ncbi:MAG: alanine racemase [Thermoanaerobaculia bacterium]
MELAAGASRPAQVVVDLDAVAANLDFLRRCAGSAALLAVVKADAYGHGVERLGPFLASRGVGWFGVALVEEGIRLREAGVGGRILVLGPVVEAERRAVIDQGLTPLVSSLEQLRGWASWSRDVRTPIRFHLKVDTGMGRWGLAMEELAEARRVLEMAAGNDGRLRLEGIASHFADAELPESAHNREQQRRFGEALETLRPVSPEGVLRHMTNSAALLHLPESRLDLVRVGLALYGVDPAGEHPGLEGVMRVECSVAEVRELPVGATVGYGSTWTASRPSRIGLLPLGYADGVPWRLGNRGQVLTDGGRAPIVGRVSMDSLAVDLTGTQVGHGDPVVLLGRHGGDRITAHDLASWAETSPYEILCGFAGRLPRRYVQGS